jgi:signal transduction histidine kinase
VSAPAQPPQILVVDDDEGLLILMAEALRGEGYTVEAAGSGRAALQWLANHRPALMLLDLKLRDLDAPALLAQLRRDRAAVPFVVVTGQGDERTAVEMMRQGALDYVMKSTGLLDLLPAVVRRALATLAQGEALAAAQHEHLRLEQEIIAAGERERHRIGADLHDNLGQQLTAIQLMCASLELDAAAHPVLAQNLRQVCRMLSEAVRQTRLLARGLVPIGPGPDALQNSLAELAARTDALGRVSCQFVCAKSVAPAEPQKTGHLYRIAQEAVNNALKHARARSVRIRLAQSKSALLLEISDDGAGLPPPTANGSAGVGLSVMRHRAAVIGARLDIVSKPGKGVTVRCHLPLSP